MFDYTEFDKLVNELKERGHRTMVIACFDGRQCLVDGKWDFIIHSGSYGHADGLLEVYGMDYLESGDVEGFLNAEDVLNRLDGKTTKKTNEDGDVFGSISAMLFGSK